MARFNPRPGSAHRDANTVVASLRRRATYGRALHALGARAQTEVVAEAVDRARLLSLRACRPSIICPARGARFRGQADTDVDAARRDVQAGLAHALSGVGADRVRAGRRTGRRRRTRPDDASRVSDRAALEAERLSGGAGTGIVVAHRLVGSRGIAWRLRRSARADRRTSTDKPGLKAVAVHGAKLCAGVRRVSGSAVPRRRCRVFVKTTPVGARAGAAVGLAPASRGDEGHENHAESPHVGNHSCRTTPALRTPPPIRISRSAIGARDGVDGSGIRETPSSLPAGARLALKTVRKKPHREVPCTFAPCPPHSLRRRHLRSRSPPACGCSRCSSESPRCNRGPRWQLPAPHHGRRFLGRSKRGARGRGPSIRRPPKRLPLAQNCHETRAPGLPDD
jgi:hypothetical protein